MYIYLGPSISKLPRYCFGSQLNYYNKKMFREYYLQVFVGFAGGGGGGGRKVMCRMVFVCVCP